MVERLPQDNSRKLGEAGSRTTELSEDLVVFAGREGTSWSAPSSSSESLVKLYGKFRSCDKQCLLFVVLCNQPGLSRFLRFRFCFAFFSCVLFSTFLVIFFWCSLPSELVYRCFTWR
jgi:hypothetical protein